MKNLRIPETYIYDLWLNKKLPSKLTTTDGNEIEILDPGVKNSDFAGPDFNHSRIRIGNITFNGDVEIDNYTTDWRAHGHHLNSRYNKTILHIVLTNNTNQTYSTNVSGRRIPILELKNYLDKDFILELEKKTDNTDDEVSMPCTYLNSALSIDDKLKFLKQLGLLKYKKKCLKILDRLKEIIFLREHKIGEPKVVHNFYKTIKERKYYSNEFDDLSLWNQILYEEIFEALGYTKNKETMSKLGKSIEYEFISKIEAKDFIIKAESLLFHISGIIPNIAKIKDEKTLEYIRELHTHWEAIKPNYNNTFFTPNNWHFFKLRPQNFPTVRLSAAARLLFKIIHQNLFKRLLDNFTKINNRSKLNALLLDTFIIKADGYWANHFNFSKEVRTNIKYFIGISRADEIIANCVLPILSVYFEIFDKRKETHKVLDLFVNYTQKESNNLIDMVSKNLNLFDYRLKSVYYQGMLELFRSNCIKNRCLECEIGQKVFS